MATKRDKSLTALRSPAGVSKEKVARALEIRKAASEARKGKPLAFPERRARPA